jgi:hypothetical protein
MTTYQIELLEPKAKKLLDELAELNLIRIQETSASKESFRLLLTKLRAANTDNDILDEITREVELVRAERYASKRST